MVANVQVPIKESPAPIVVRSDARVQLGLPLLQQRVGPQARFEVPPRIGIPLTIQLVPYESLCGTKTHHSSTSVIVPPLDVQLLLLGEVLVPHPFWHDGKPQDALITNK